MYFQKTSHEKFESREERERERTNANKGLISPPHMCKVKLWMNITPIGYNIH
jgi:hypothetical protein